MSVILEFLVLWLKYSDDTKTHDFGSKTCAWNANGHEIRRGFAMVLKGVVKEVLSCITVGLSSGNDNAVLRVFYISSIIYIYTSFTDTLGTLRLWVCTRRSPLTNIEWNRRRTRFDSLLPQSPLHSSCSEAKAEVQGLWTSDALLWMLSSGLLAAESFDTNITVNRREEGNHQWAIVIHLIFQISLAPRAT